MYSARPLKQQSAHRHVILRGLQKNISWCISAPVDCYTLTNDRPCSVRLKVAIPHQDRYIRRQSKIARYTIGAHQLPTDYTVRCRLTTNSMRFRYTDMGTVPTMCSSSPSIDIEFNSTMWNKYIEVFYSSMYAFHNKYTNLVLIELLSTSGLTEGLTVSSPLVIQIFT
jgi:hypothetical protein